MSLSNYHLSLSGPSPAQEPKENLQETAKNAISRDSCSKSASRKTLAYKWTIVLISWIWTDILNSPYRLDLSLLIVILSWIGTAILGNHTHLELSLQIVLIVLQFWICTNTLWNCTGRDLGLLLQPKLGPGRKRIHWTCKCGHQSFDDFTELRPGSVKEYEEKLKMSSVPEQQPGTSPQTGAPLQKSNPLVSFLNFFRTREETREASLPHYQTPQQNHNQPTPPPSPPADRLFLLICIPHRKYANKLIQVDVRKINSDQALFTLLRNSYKSMRSRFRSTLSLKTIKRIKFVQFELFHASIADIRKEDDLPPEERKEEYSYNPCPPDFIPPIGENYMMHLYGHPEDANHAAGVCLDRIPKKLRDRLFVCLQKALASDGVFILLRGGMPM
ncbi:hypothetical protein MMC20_001161 [Loxospora ochrophaea]|nr:hypothetical protein [Loxospora ochrophaea]